MKKTINDINFISLRIKHHANASGYDQLINRVNSKSVVTLPEMNFMHRVIARGMKPFIKNSGSTWYKRTNFIAELKLSKKWLKNNSQIFHFLYGENSYRYSGMLKRLNKKNYIVCTYHTPPSRFQEVVHGRDFLKRLDAIIVVSTMQQNYFSEIVGSERVFYVPHGIDTEYFSPSYSTINNDSLHCLCVGSHLRDYETLGKAADILLKQSNKIKITVVTSNSNKSFLPKSENVIFLNGVTDEELLMLYRSADLLLLPLLDCTANNSLLEGMACGLPIITTDLPGVKDYVDDTCSMFVEKGDYKGLANKVLEVLDSNVDLSTMSKNSRAQSMKFDWQRVVIELEEIYSKIGNKK